MDKYEYFSGEDLGLKPSTIIEQTKFEYSPLGKIFNKGLSDDDKKKDCLRDQKILKMHKRNWSWVMIMKVFTTHLDHNLIIKKMIKIK